MKSCDTCRWNTEECFCLQGHRRQQWVYGTYRLRAINCHAWAEKEEKKCWCADFKEESPKQIRYYDGFNWILWTPKFCPECGRKP
jgi:hypothetical protein